MNNVRNVNNVRKEQRLKRIIFEGDGIWMNCCYLLPREQEMQLVGQTSVEGKLLEDAWTTRTIADAEDGTVEIEDDLSRGFELIVVAL